MIKRILRLFFSNIPFKIFAVVLALSVWGLAVLFRIQTVNTTVPVEFTNLPSDLIITKVNTDKVIATFQGQGTDFLKLLLHPPKYQLNLAMIKPGYNRIKLAPDELIISAPILLKSIVPEYSEITTDQLESKIVNIIIPYRIEPQKGIYITNVITKDPVMLFGPKQEMKFIDEMLTDSLFISDYSRPQVTRKLHVVLPDSKLFKTNPESVTVIASIEKEETITFSDISVNITVSSQNSAALKPKIAQITVRGATSRIQTLKATDIKVNINAVKLNPGEYKIPSEISLPKGIFLVRCEPQLFEVKIR